MPKMLPCRECNRPRAVRPGATERPLCQDCRRNRSAKECARCHDVKTLDDFPRAAKAGGRASYCKPCHVARQRELGSGGYAARCVTCPDCGAERVTRGDSERCRRCYGIAQRHPDYDTRGPARGVKRPPLPVPRARVFERDEWTCGICHEGIDRTLAWPHELCGVVDHVYPVAAGGPNEPWNLQAAHNLCNRVKGDKESPALYDQAIKAKLELTGSV